jgi:hypothetical protein
LASARKKSRSEISMNCTPSSTQDGKRCRQKVRNVAQLLLRKTEVLAQLWRAIGTVAGSLSSLPGWLDQRPSGTRLKVPCGNFSIADQIFHGVAPSVLFLNVRLCTA